MNPRPRIPDCIGIGKGATRWENSEERFWWELDLKSSGEVFILKIGFKPRDLPRPALKRMIEVELFPRTNAGASTKTGFASEAERQSKSESFQWVGLVSHARVR